MRIAGFTDYVYIRRNKRGVAFEQTKANNM